MTDSELKQLQGFAPGLRYVYERPRPCCNTCNFLSWAENGNEYDDYHGINCCAKHPGIIFGYEPHRIYTTYADILICPDYQVKSLVENE